SLRSTQTSIRDFSTLCRRSIPKFSCPRRSSRLLMRGKLSDPVALGKTHNRPVFKRRHVPICELRSNNGQPVNWDFEQLVLVGPCRPLTECPIVRTRSGEVSKLSWLDPRPFASKWC